MSEPAYHNKPLTYYILKSWRQLLTRHQLAVSGFRMVDGVRRRVDLPFKRKGQHKLQPNNPRRPDGAVHEYCPPEQEASDE
ncbi:MAG: hypothetical protein OXD47_03690 [Gammaproteobacteria bacterium]|nr:hypothetical protein [Gammaproteobacteria bacterium]